MSDPIEAERMPEESPSQTSAPSAPQPAPTPSTEPAPAAASASGAAVPAAAVPDQAAPGPASPGAAPYGAVAGGYRPQQLPPFNVMAIIAFAGSFISPVVGIVCGHITLNEYRKGLPERGREYALAGLILGYVFTALWIVVGILWLVFALRSGVAHTVPLEGGRGGFGGSGGFGGQVPARPQPTP